MLPELKLGYGKEIAPAYRRTVVESNVWSGEIPSNGQHSKVSKLGNLDNVGAVLEYVLEVRDAYVRDYIESRQFQSIFRNSKPGPRKMGSRNTYTGDVN